VQLHQSAKVLHDEIRMMFGPEGDDDILEIRGGHHRRPGLDEPIGSRMAEIAVMRNEIAEAGAAALAEEK
jgi:hypothetical protein